MALMSAGARPSLPRRRSVSAMLKPQSTRMRVAPDSTMRPLPSLPLPIDAKRINLSSLQLIVKQREDAIRGGRTLRRAVLVEHVHFGALAFIFHQHAILLVLVLVAAAVAPELEAREETLVAGALVVDFGIDVAHEVQAFRAVAILDGEADAIEREADAAP